MKIKNEIGWGKNVLKVKKQTKRKGKRKAKENGKGMKNEKKKGKRKRKENACKRGKKRGKESGRKAKTKGKGWEKHVQKKRERERTSKKWREWKNGERTGREIDEEKASSVSSIRRFIYCTWLNHGGARTFSTFALLWNGSKEQRRRTKRKCAVNKCLSGRLNLYKLGQAPHSFADLAKHVNTIINWNWKWIAHWGWMDHSAARSVSSFQCMVPSATLQVIPLPKLCFWGPELVRTA